MWFVSLLALLVLATALTVALSREAARRLGVSWPDALVWLGIWTDASDHEATIASRAERRARDARKAAESRRRASARGSSASSRTVARRTA
jgi:hypothetical protein